MYDDISQFVSSTRVRIMEILPVHAEHLVSSVEPKEPNKTLLFLVVFQTVVLIVILCILIALAPEVARVLKDVQVVMPEMKLSIERMGRMVPEVDRGVRILDQACVVLNLGSCA